MYFANRGLSSFLVLGLVLMTIVLFINILPALLVIGAGVWGVTFIVKRIKKWYSAASGVTNSKVDKTNVEHDHINTDFSSSNVIDVEYTEIK